MKHCLLISILFSIFGLILSSVGDKSTYYRNCIQNCFDHTCQKNVQKFGGHRGGGSSSRTKHKNNGLSDFEVNQSIYLKYLGWGCYDECKYECMWHTVDYFTETERRDVPQFYGKWPFIRIYGIQEPASAIASVLNLSAHLYMLTKMSRQMSLHTPFKSMWMLFGVCSINTWIWSTIFHTRDFDFTEKMDYFSAFSLVLLQFNCFFIRVFKLKRTIMATLLMYLICILSAIYYLYHVYYLSSIDFDYGYNMEVNIFFGALNSVCWIVWSLYKCFYLGHTYAWRCAVSVLLVDVLMSLEIFDFSPILWTIDSHAMWHISTISIPFFWYQFIIDDNYYVDLKSMDKKL